MFEVVVTEVVACSMPTLGGRLGGWRVTGEAGVVPIVPLGMSSQEANSRSRQASIQDGTRRELCRDSIGLHRTDFVTARVAKDACV